MGDPLPVVYGVSAYGPVGWIAHRGLFSGSHRNSLEILQAFLSWRSWLIHKKRDHPFGSAADSSSTRELRVPINEENNEVRFLDGGNVHLGLIRGKHQRGMCSDVVLSRRYSALKNI